MASSPSPWRAFRSRFLIALGVSSVLAVGGVVVGNQVIDEKLSEIHRVDELVLASEGPAEAGNYLIVGSDTRQFVEGQTEEAAFGSADVETGQRSDTIMVLHLDPAAKSGLLVSFPRDLLVNIPGQGRGMINSAYNDNANGEQKLIDTLKANFGLEISHYVEVNFKAFIGLVNAVGEIPVYFPAPARDEWSGLDIGTAGCIPLNGDQALAYVRSRQLLYLDAESGEYEDADGHSDLNRITRQQNFIRRLAGAASAKAGSNPLKALDIADAVIPKLHVDTELTKEDIFRMVQTFRKVNPESDDALEMITLPVGQAPSDPNRVVAKQPEANQVIARLNTFGSQETEEEIKILPSQVRVRVLNGSGVSGAAAAAMAEIQKYTFAPAGVGNAGTVDATQIRYTPGSEQKAKLVARYLGGVGALVADDTIADADVVIVLGPDFQGVAAPGKKPAGTSTTTSAEGTSPTTKAPKGGTAPVEEC